MARRSGGGGDAASAALGQGRAAAGQVGPAGRGGGVRVAIDVSSRPPPTLPAERRVPAGRRRSGGTARICAVPAGGACD